jgi:hypothetical protein
MMARSPPMGTTTDDDNPLVPVILFTPVTAQRSFANLFGITGPDLEGRLVV